MWLQSLLNSRQSSIRPSTRRARRLAAGVKQSAFRPLIEALEERCLLSFSPVVNYAVGSSPYAVLAADFNHDNVQDLAVVNYYGSSVSVLRGNGDVNGTFQTAQNFATGSNPVSLAVGDFNGDGKLDIMTVNGSNMNVLRGNDDCTFQTPQTTTLPFYPASVAVGDVNADGKLDLVATSNDYVIDGYYYYYGYYGGLYSYPYGHYEGRVNVVMGNGDGTFAPPITTDLGEGYAGGVAAENFNSDTNLDVAVLESGNVRVLAGNGDGTFGAPVDYATDGAQSILVGDANGDGIHDLITKNGSSVGVLLGNGAAGVGDGTFQPALNTPLNFYPNSLATGDINADGKLDLVTTSSEYVIDGYYYGYYGGLYSYGHYEGRVNVLLGHGDGGFAAPRTTAVDGSYLPAVAAADFNGDGFTDVAVSDWYANNLSVLINQQDWRSFTISGMPSSTTAGDSHSVTVTALDNAGNVLTNYTGTVHFGSSDAQASILPADYTFTPGDHGVHTFSVTLFTAGTQSITVADTTAPDFLGSQDVVVNPGEAKKLVMTSLPSTLSTGDYAYFSVSAYDDFGNLATNYTGTVHFSSSDGSASLPANSIITGGIAYFSASLTTVGTQSITVADSTNSALTDTETGIRVLPRASITGPYYAARNQTLSFTLGATSGLPASTVFSYAIDWNGDGIVDQTVSGANGATVNHSYASSGYYYAVVTATATIAGQTYTSYSTYQTVYVFDVSATIQADPGDSSKSALVVEGGSYADTIVLSPGAGNSVALSYNGYSLGTYSTASGVAFAHLLMYGYGGNDTLRLSGGVTVPAVLFGGDGNDTLDASGSSANNVLIGEGGNDALTGGSGRELLIGGRGGDTLHGGSNDDILIGGYTDFDANTAALLAIVKEWGRTDATYATRISHLNGSASGGQNFVGTTAIRLTASTVHATGTVNDDNAVDSLYGDAGTDWFFARKRGPRKDKVNDLSTGEVFTEVS